MNAFEGFCILLLQEAEPHNSQLFLQRYLDDFTDKTALQQKKKTPKKRLFV